MSEARFMKACKMPERGFSSLAATGCMHSTCAFVLRIAMPCQKLTTPARTGFKRYTRVATLTTKVPYFLSQIKSFSRHEIDQVVSFALSNVFISRLE